MKSRKFSGPTILEPLMLVFLLPISLVIVTILWATEKFGRFDK